MNIQSIYFSAPVRVPGSRTVVRHLLASDGFVIERGEGGVFVSKGGDAASWVPDTSIEYASVTTGKKAK